MAFHTVSVVDREHFAARYSKPVLLRINQAGILFPMLMFLAIWLALAAVWPRRAPALEAVPAEE